MISARTAVTMLLLSAALVPATSGSSADTAIAVGASPPAESWLRAAESHTPLVLETRWGNIVLDVRVNVDLLADGLVVADGRGRSVDTSGVTPIEGSVVGVPGSVVRTTVFGDSVVGYVLVPGAGAIAVAPGPAGVLLMDAQAAARSSPSVQFEAWSPVGRGSGDLPVGQGAVRLVQELIAELQSDPASVVFDFFSVPDEDRPQSHDDLQGWARAIRAIERAVVECEPYDPQPVADPSGLMSGWPQRTLDVALAVDAEFVELHGPDWAAYAIAVANGVDGVYAPQIGLRVRVADLHAHEPDVFPGLTASDLLSDLEQHYNGAHSNIARDAAHLLTGRDSGDTTAGMANCIGGAGRPDVAYSVGKARGEGAGSFDILGIPFMTHMDVTVFAHEVGHLLGGVHERMNCVEPLPNYSLSAAGDVCTLMSMDASVASLQLSTANRLVMRGVVDASGL